MNDPNHGHFSNTKTLSSKIKLSLTQEKMGYKVV